MTKPVKTLNPNKGTIQITHTDCEKPYYTLNYTTKSDQPGIIRNTFSDSKSELNRMARELLRDLNEEIENEVIR